MTGPPEVPADPGRANPWPWGLAGAFALFVVAQVVLVGIAVSRFEPPEDGQYYRHGLELDPVLKARRRQHDEGWRFAWTLPSPIRAGGPREVRLELTDPRGRRFEQGRVSIHVGRPATPREDRDIVLREGAGGVYAGVLQVGPGPWDLTVQATRGDLVLTDRKRVVVLP